MLNEGNNGIYVTEHESIEFKNTQTDKNLKVSDNENISSFLFY